VPGLSDEQLLASASPAKGAPRGLSDEELIAQGAPRPRVTRQGLDPRDIQAQTPGAGEVPSAIEAANQPEQLGIGETAWRTLQAGAVEPVRRAGMAASTVVRSAQDTWNVLSRAVRPTGINLGQYSNQDQVQQAIFDATENLVRPAEEHSAIGPNERPSMIGQVAGGIAGMPQALFTGGGGLEIARQMAERGATPEEMLKAGVTQEAIGQVANLLPFSIAARGAARMGATPLVAKAAGIAGGAVLNPAVSAFGRAATSATLPERPEFEGMQQPAMPTPVQATTEVLTGALFGHQGAAEAAAHGRFERQKAQAVEALRNAGTPADQLRAIAGTRQEAAGGPPAEPPAGPPGAPAGEHVEAAPAPGEPGEEVGPPRHLANVPGINVEPIEAEHVVGQPAQSPREAELKRLIDEAQTPEAKKLLRDELKAETAAQARTDAADEMRGLAERTRDEATAARLRAQAEKLAPAGIGIKPRAEPEPERPTEAVKAPAKAAPPAVPEVQPGLGLGLEPKPPEPEPRVPVEPGAKVTATPEGDRGPAPAPEERTHTVGSSPLFQRMIDEGRGIQVDAVKDLGIENHQKIMIGGRGRGRLFRKSGMTMDGMVEWLHQNNYITDRDIEEANQQPGGDHELARSLIQREMAQPGSVHPMIDEESRFARMASKRAEAEILDQADAAGIPTAGRSIDDVHTDLQAHRDRELAGQHGFESDHQQHLTNAVLVHQASRLDEAAVERLAVKHADDTDHTEFMAGIQRILDEHRAEPVQPGAKPVAERPGALEKPAIRREPEANAPVQAGEPHPLRYEPGGRAGERGPEPEAGPALQPAGAERGRAAAAGERGAVREDFQLTPPEPARIRREAVERERAEKAEKARREAPPPEDFRLTGSKREADKAAAAGQTSLFDLPARPEMEGRGSELGKGETEITASKSIADAALGQIRHQKTKVGFTTARHLKIPDKLVETPEDAAHVLAPMRRAAQEQFLALVTDKDGKPLAVIRHSVGGSAQVAVHTDQLYGSIFAVPGGKNVWFAHNHPSGAPTPSGADTRLTHRLEVALRGTGMNVQGHVILTNSRKFGIVGITSPGTMGGAVRGGEVPLVERQFRGVKSDRIPVTGPTSARAALDSHFGPTEHGVMFLDHQNRAVGALRMTPEEMRRLRTGDPTTGFGRLAAAQSHVGATGVITKVPGGMGGQRAVENIGAALREMEVRHVDAFSGDNDVGYSNAGLPLASKDDFASMGPWRSALHDEVDKLPMKAGTGNAWAEAIKGLVNKGRVKQDEIEWSGLPEYLKAAGGKLTREQVTDFLKNNGVQVQEVAKGEEDLRPPAGFDYTKRDDGYHILQYNGDTGDHDRGRPLKMGKDLGTTVQGMQDKLHRRADLAAERNPELAQKLRDDANSLERWLGGTDDQAENGPKYGSYTLPGGKNYRELLLTLPSPGRGYRGPHWDEPNVLAHVRMNDRTDTEGNRVLHLEEVQSDWGQQAKKKGFQSVTGEDLAAASEKEYQTGRALSAARAFRDRQEAMYDQAVAKARQLHADPHAAIKAQQDVLDREQDMLAAREAVLEARDAAQAAEQEHSDLYIRQGSGVPVGPFVGKTHEWTALAMKRVMRYAAENGYDKVSWTHGEQQAKRYDLSKHIAELNYRKNTTRDGYEVGFVDKDGADRLAAANATPEQLEELVGKELAQKIINDQGEAVHNSEFRAIRGLDLKVGGEGMSGYYDKILPNVTNDLLRKFGGGKVGTVEHGTPRGIVRAQTRDQIAERIYGQGSTYEALPPPSREMVDKQMARQVRSQPGFDITPELRARAMQGMPMFRRGAEAETSTGPHEIIDSLRKAWGGKTTDALIDSGILRVEHSSESPSRLADNPKVRAIASEMDPRGPGVSLFHDRMDPQIAPAYAAHEIGWHYAARRWLTPEVHDKILGDLKEVHQAGTDPEVEKAWNTVEKNYISVQDGKTVPMFLPGDRRFLEEVAAHLAESASETGFVKGLFDQARAWLYKATGGRLGAPDAGLVRGITSAAMRSAAAGRLDKSPLGMRVPAEEAAAWRDRVADILAGNEGHEAAAIGDRQPPETQDETARPLLARVREMPLVKSVRENFGGLRDEALRGMAPMAIGSDRARGMAKDWANKDRLARWQWQQFDEVIRKSYTPEQRRAMWEAGDEENDLRREGVTDENRGLGRLTPEQQDTMRVLHDYGEQLLDRARESGMFHGQGVHYWAPRMAALIGEDGSVDRVGLPPEIPGKEGRNIVTSSPSLLRRKYATTAEAEAALKGGFGERAEFVKDILTMPLAMSRLERAVAGRELINQIKAIGHEAGEDLVSTTAHESRFTIDHPAFKTYRHVQQEVPVKEAFDRRLWEGLEKVAGALGVEHERLAKMRGGIWGLSHQGGDRVETRFAGPETVLTHELGHQIDHKYDLSSYFHGPGVPTELRKLADLRFEGQEDEVSQNYRRYVRQSSEKMANMVHAYVHMPDRFQEVAPKTFKAFEKFLDAHPEVGEPLRVVRPSLVLGSEKMQMPITVPEKIPLYMSREFEGPMRAIMSEPSSKTYQALMGVKALAMQAIMYSPLIHNAVEWGRAMPAAPGKVLTGYIYFQGNKVKNDPLLMREAIQAGLVPIGHYGGTQDITGVLEHTPVDPRRQTWLQAPIVKGAAALARPLGEKASAATARGVQKAADIWHNTLLWDRVGDLQAGLYAHQLEHFTKQGMDRETAARVAAHEANRYAGSVPNEAMSTLARKATNLAFFSRSFTFGNLGVMKDMLTGLPKDVQAQIARDAGPEALKQAVSAGRRKAIGAFALDIGLMYLVNSTLQDYLQKRAGEGAGGIPEAAAGLAQGDLPRANAAMADYYRRATEVAQRIHENPMNALDPFGNLRSLTPMGENEPQHTNRVLAGYSKDGTAIYARLPTGKIGEEFEGWSTEFLQMLHRKESTLLGPALQVFNNDRGFGRPVYDKDAAWYKQLGQSVLHIAGGQTPLDSAKSLAKMASGNWDEMDALKVLGPLGGVTFSKGAPGGPQVGQLLEERKRHNAEIASAAPDVREALKNGDVESAHRMMEAAHMSPAEQRTMLRIAMMPGQVSKQAERRFQQTATPEEQARMRRFQLERTQREAAAAPE
jgi:RadC-like JAB domain